MITALSAIMNTGRCEGSVIRSREAQGRRHHPSHRLDREDLDLGLGALGANGLAHRRGGRPVAVAGLLERGVVDVHADAP